MRKTCEADGNDGIPIPEFSKLEIDRQTRRSQPDVDNIVDIMETLRKRFLGITVGVLTYLLVEERESIGEKYEGAIDLVDSIRVALFVTFIIGLAPISQLLWDCVAVFLHWIFSGPFWLKRRQSCFYKYMIGAMHGCVGLYGYFLAMFGSGMWKDLEEKSKCLVRWRGTSSGGPTCEYHILRITLGLEQKYCQLASPVCSKLVFLGPYMLIGGLLSLIGALVAMEYLGCYETSFEELDTINTGKIDKQTLKITSEVPKEVAGGSGPQ